MPRVELTESQKRVMDCITKHYTQYGCSPTIRELQADIGADSIQTVHNILKGLEDTGMIHREREKQRAITIIKQRDNYTLAPLVKKLYAPDILFDCQNVESYYPLPKTIQQDNVFLYRMEGNALVGRCILDQDILIFSTGEDVVDGDLVAVLADGFPVIRILSDDKTLLKAANRAFSNIVPQEMEVIGKLISIMRYF